MDVFGNGAWGGGGGGGEHYAFPGCARQLLSNVLAFGATFCGSSNLEQTCISEQVSVHGNVLNVYQFFYNFSFFFNFFFFN